MSRRKRNAKAQTHKCARRKRGKRSSSRRVALILGIAAVTFLTLWSWASLWFVHHSRKWLRAHEENWPRIVTGPLLALGEPLGDFTDALGLTGRDVVYDFDQEAPRGTVFFAGAPVRLTAPAPSDIRIVDRGEFAIGWSDRLRHPAWVAYHVPADARFEVGERPNFTKDKAVPLSPPSSSYDRSNYDRGHMAPNYAMVTRFGEDVQKATFLMSNIAPQSPSLNRGVWRDLEHRIADLWTARWGEIWVIVGSIPSETMETLSGTGIDVPSKFYQLIVAQEGTDVRVMALVFDQTVSGREWPTRHLVTVDELEEMTGLDFLPELESFIQDPLEAELPSRLWPIRKGDIFKKLFLRCH